MKCPAGLPPTRSAKIAAESGLGWHSQLTLASGVSSATVRPLASIECRSIGTARSPKSQCRRVSSSSAERAGRLDRLGHPVVGLGLAGADLDAEVGAVQVGRRRSRR